MAMRADHKNLLRASTLKFLGGCCRACGETVTGDLHVHHIQKSNLGEGRGSRERAWENLALAFTGEGFLLCSYCHGLFHSNDKMIWLQQNKTEEFREAMRRDFCVELNNKGNPKIEIFKERGG